MQASASIRINDQKSRSQCNWKSTCKNDKIPVKRKPKVMDNLIFRSNQEQNKFIECNAVIPLNVHKRWENIIKVVAPQWLNLIRESNDHRTNT